ncbi:HAD family hydrolase [Nonomuraea rhodomycinica]|uniref:HAD family hydrolase n=1 Tax=Nonomuraea rhodomycinica TaxID=1712872 RepID=A0A7Y6IIM3_9ACTN|nr:HAD hydrolase family protein [Nonomuraea rhodomycinica]NUW38691.1 HAD family hydrolase [Nonomuraea rhodomycinica]
MIEPIRYAAFDLDGTLLDANGDALPGLAAGLTRLRDLGLVSILITGRSLASLRAASLDEELLALLEPQVLISDGDAVFDRRCGLFRQTRALPEGLGSHLLEKGFEDVVVEAGGDYYASSRRAALVLAMAYRLPRAVVSIGLPSQMGIPLGRAVVLAEQSRVRAALDGFRCVTRRLTAFGATLIHPEGTGKSGALAAHLLAEFGEQGLERTIAFGDGPNDAGLLAECRIGIAMREGAAAAVAAADLHLTESLGEFLRDLAPQRLIAAVPADRTETTDSCVRQLS